MKKFLSIGFLLALAATANAQIFYSVVGGGTNKVTAAATNTYTTVYPRLVNTRVATVKASFAGADAGTDNVVVLCDGSVDGGNSWVLGGIGSLTIAADGTTGVTNATTVDTGGYNLMRVRVGNVSSSVDVTNLVVQVGLKRGVEPSTPIAIAYGGTAGSTAAAARTALGVVASTAGTATGLTLAGTTTNSGLTASLPVFTGPQKQLASKSIADTKVALGIDSGSCISAADGTVTNAFAFTFSAAPIVVVTQSGVANSPTNAVESVTTTNFVLRSGTPSVTNKWIAVGVP